MNANAIARRAAYRLQHPDTARLADRLANFLRNPANTGTPAHTRIMELIALARDRRAQGMKPQ